MKLNLQFPSSLWVIWLIFILLSLLSTFSDFSVGIFASILHHILNLHGGTPLEIRVGVVLLVGKILHLRVNGCLLDLSSLLFLEELVVTFNSGIDLLLLSG